MDRKWFLKVLILLCISLITDDLSIFYVLQIAYLSLLSTV